MRRAVDCRWFQSCVEILRSCFDTSARTQGGFPFALSEISPAFAWQCNRQATGSCFLREVSKGANGKRDFCSRTSIAQTVYADVTQDQSARPSNRLTEAIIWGQKPAHRHPQREVLLFERARRWQSPSSWPFWLASSQSSRQAALYGR
jgi:hypothetical protein